jgi:hypothetical protein
MASLDCEECHSLTAPSSGFRNLSTALSATWLVGLFHPTGHIQGSSCSGASPFVQLFSLIESPLPPCRFHERCSPTEIGCHLVRPRLRGFRPHEEALLQFGVNRPTARSPRQVFVSSRFLSLPTVGFSAPKPSTHDVTGQGLRSHDNLSRPPPAYSG